MNSNQKKIILFAGILSLLSFAMWAVSGFRLLTSFNESFLWGLDLSLLVSGIALIAGGIIFRKNRLNKEISTKS